MPKTGDVSCQAKEGHKRSVCILTKLSDSPFAPVGPGLEELLLSGPGPLEWYRLTVPDPYGFVSLELPCDIMQLYTDGTLTADDFYHGVPWRLPKKAPFREGMLRCHHNNRNRIYIGNVRFTDDQIRFSGEKIPGKTDF